MCHSCESEISLLTKLKKTHSFTSDFNIPSPVTVFKGVSSVLTCDNSATALRAGYYFLQMDHHLLERRNKIV